ncbi:MAG: ABC transporter ATP-binding protein [Lachnospiraceae bacterium]|nr:ABC transporter ATP-binding protein [Lachnospiraceae bacterium]
MGKERLLTVENLKVSFLTANGEVQAVRGIDFSLDRGETLAIVGESGCGKSVTVQTVMRLNPEPPAEIRGGSIRYTNGSLDVDIARLSDKEMEKLRGKEFSMIFQDAMTSLNPTTKVGKQICEAIRKHAKVPYQEAREKAISLLAKVGLPNPEQVFERFPHTMSGGQRQRVMIAMALSCDPAILFADEPTTALDVTIQSQILNLMNDLKREANMSIIFITHNLGVVARMADRVAVMYAGQIIETGSLNDIFYHARHPYTWGLLGSVPQLHAQERSRLYSIPGTPPDLFAPPRGCGFAARCPYCMNVCMDHAPCSYQITEEHSANCWLLDRECPVEVPQLVGRDQDVLKLARTQAES